MTIRYGSYLLSINFIANGTIFGGKYRGVSRCDDPCTDRAVQKNAHPGLKFIRDSKRGGKYVHLRCGKRTKIDGQTSNGEPKKFHARTPNSEAGQANTTLSQHHQVCSCTCKEFLKNNTCVGLNYRVKMKKLSFKNLVRPQTGWPP